MSKHALRIREREFINMCTGSWHDLSLSLVWSYDISSICFLTIDSFLKAVKKEKLVRKFQHATSACVNIHAPSTHIRFRLKKEIFSPTWPTRIRWKRSSEMHLFKKRSPKWKCLKTPFCCTQVDVWKRRFLKTITTRCTIPANALAPVRDSTVFIGHYCVFVWTRILLRTAKKNLRTQTKMDTWEGASD